MDLARNEGGGAPLEERGVTIMSIRNGRIARGRLYLEETEREGADITETVRRHGRLGGSLGSGHLRLPQSLSSHPRH